MLLSKREFPKFKLPYDVKKFLHKDCYLIGDIDVFQIIRKQFSSVYIYDRMFPWDEQTMTLFKDDSDGRGDLLSG